MKFSMQGLKRGNAWRDLGLGESKVVAVVCLSAFLFLAILSGVIDSEVTVPPYRMGVSLLLTVPRSDRNLVFWSAILFFMAGCFHFPMWRQRWSLRRRLLAAVLLVLSFPLLANIKRRSSFWRQQHQHQTGIGKQKSCITPGLPNERVAIVVAMRDDTEITGPTLQDIWALGLTNASVYVYYKTGLKGRQRIPASDSATPMAFSSTQFSEKILEGSLRPRCGEKVFETTLFPNSGNEASVFADFMARKYDALPDFMLFAHDHLGLSWHSLRENFTRRSRAYYIAVRDEVLKAEHFHPGLRLWASEAVSLNDDKPVVQEALEHATLSERRRLLEANTQDEILQDSSQQREDRVLWFRLDQDLVGQGKVNSTQEELYWAMMEKAMSRVVPNFKHPPGGEPCTYWSCCAQFLARPQNVHAQGKEYWEAARDWLLATTFSSHYTGRWFEFRWYELLHSCRGTGKNSTLMRLVDGNELEGYWLD